MPPCSPIRSERSRLRVARSVGRGLLLALVATGLASGLASALSFQVDFVQSTYQTQSGDTFSDLLAQHQAGALIESTVTTGLEDISTTIYANGVTTNYSVLMMTRFDVGVGGTYSFQVGTDWGRGGAAALIDDSDGSVVYERVITDDVWWANDWNNPDVFTTTFAFQPGDSYTLMWVGFEDCCGGSSTVRFSVDGGSFQAVDETNLEPFAATVPEPSTAALIGMGLMVLGLRPRPPEPASSAPRAMADGV